MGKVLIRFFREAEIEEIRQHLLLLGDLSSDCGNCKHLGLDASSATSCPECGTTFKYVTSRRLEGHPGERFSIVKRSRSRRPDLEFIDYSDYTKCMGQKTARDFFG